MSRLIRPRVYGGEAQAAPSGTGGSYYGGGGERTLLPTVPPISSTYGDAGPSAAATFGGTFASTYGPPSATADPGAGWVVTLEAGDGAQRRILESDLRELGRTRDIQIDLEHTALCSFRASVGHDPSLEAWRFSTVSVTYDGRQLFAGRLTNIDSDKGSAATQLGGDGPLGRYTRGDIGVRFDGVKASEAISDVWLEHTDADVAVIPHPDGDAGEFVFQDFEASGAPISILKTMHEEAGMRFVVDHSKPPGVPASVESFYPQSRVRRPSWRAIDRSRSLDITDYANAASVTGAVVPQGANPPTDHTRIMPDGEVRWHAEARNEQEIEDVTNGNALVYPHEEDELDSFAACEAKAESLVRSLVAEDSLAGDIEVVPALVTPGYAYRIAEWEQTGGEPVIVSLETASYSESAGDASGSLSFGRDKGVVGAIQQLRGNGRRPPGLVGMGARPFDEYPGGYGEDYGRDYQ